MYDIHSGGVTMNSLEIRNITKRYDSFLLDNISFDIPKGYIMGFIGENGAGKTTTIKSILNLINKDNGSVKVFDLDMDQHELEIKKRIGFVSGDNFYPKRKIKDITSVYRRFFDDFDDTLYKEYLTKFNLNPEKKIDELSKGMKMKYSIALALSHNAELLILDEPTSGLDPVARDGLLEVFQSIVETGERSILFSTHITSDLEKCADYITFIQNGKIVESCAKDDLIDKYRIVNGTTDDLNSIKDKLVAYKVNSLGFNGLMMTKEVDEKMNVNIGQPSLDEIMIYYAEEVK